jgi:DNA-directed RNA polymerase subunit F
MTIKNSESLSMTEALEYIKKDEEKETDIVGFIKKFSKLKAKEAKVLKQEIEGINSIKIMPEHIVKIIDILPENAEELNKIFVDVSLDEDETKKVLDSIKKLK